MEFCLIMKVQEEENFVSRKITMAAASIKWKPRSIKIGNLDAKRDWGHAKDYVNLMWKILQNRVLAIMLLQQERLILLSCGTSFPKCWN